MARESSRRQFAPFHRPIFSARTPQASRDELLPNLVYIEDPGGRTDPRLSCTEGEEASFASDGSRPIDREQTDRDQTIDSEQSPASNIEEMDRSSDHHYFAAVSVARHG